MKFLYPIIILLAFALPISAQVTFQPKSVDIDYKGVVYNTEQTVDLRVHANGWAVAYNTGKIVSYDRTKYYHFEIGKHSDPREKLQSRPYNLNLVRGVGSFAYGKINSFYSARVGLGKKKYLSEKAKRQGIAVAYNYEIGPALGFLKPYYVEIYVDNPDGSGVSTDVIRYTEDNAEQFLDLQSISGEANFAEGILETKILPGIQGKIGIHFDAGAYDEYVKAIEIGAMAEIYTQTVPIMAPSENHSNKPFFFNLYVNLHFGKRN